LSESLEGHVVDEDLAEVGVSRQERVYAREVIPADGLPEFAGLFERLDVLLQLGPAWETVVAGQLKLGGSQGGGYAGTDQILGLVTQMSETRAFGKLHGEILSSARCPHIRAKGVSHKTKLGRLGFYPFRGPAASLTLVR
jgi:hypothetical protein